MGVQVLTPNVKPRPWLLGPSGIDPRYSFVWEKPLALYPFFEAGGLTVFSEGRNYIEGAINSGDNWEHGQIGIGLRKQQATGGIVLDNATDENWLAPFEDPWTVWMVFEMASITHDENVLWSRSNDAGAQNRVFMLRTTLTNGFIEFRKAAASIVTGTNSISLNRPYLAVAASDGDTTSQNLHIYVCDLVTGQWLEFNLRGDMTVNGASPTSDPPLRMGGKDTASDDMDGIIYAAGINFKYWDPATVQIMAEDVFGWMRPIRRRSVRAPVAVVVQPHFEVRVPAIA